MSLKSLVLCADEKIVRVLRRVLSDLEISIEHCTDPDGAIHKLTRQRFEAVIIDCTDMKTATSVLKSARSAPANKRAIAVAIMDGHTGLRSAFDMGAHFVLYKPVSTERARSSFRAARALMKRERRRNSRVAVQVPVALKNDRTGFMQTVPTSDLSEGGMAVQFAKQQKDPGPWQCHFKLPGSDKIVEVMGEVAWQNPGGQIGIRFANLEVDLSHDLRHWLNMQSPENEKDDPPVRCKLTDLSLGGCYLEIASPFPPRTRIVLSMRAADLELRVEGVVRVMHPELGMGVEFTRSTTEQRSHVEKFIQSLMKAGDLLPDLLVEPEGLESSGPGVPGVAAAESDVEDPLLDLFRRQSSLSTELFLNELRKQRRTHHSDTSEETILPV
ncbi:MAG TPA: PilZ domain-containing protein [Terriglobales bacterium]|nr:PilZ domain-containing protein [Terriglobales bacterium]